MASRIELVEININLWVKSGGDYYEGLERFRKYSSLYEKIYREYNADRNAVMNTAMNIATVYGPISVKVEKYLENIAKVDREFHNTAGSKVLKFISKYSQPPVDVEKMYEEGSIMCNEIIRSSEKVMKSLIEASKYTLEIKNNKYLATEIKSNKYNKPGGLFGIWGVSADRDELLGSLGMIFKYEWNKINDVVTKCKEILKSIKKKSRDEYVNKN